MQTRIFKPTRAQLATQQLNDEMIIANLGPKLEQKPVAAKPRKAHIISEDAWLALVNRETVDGAEAAANENRRMTRRRAAETIVLGSLITWKIGDDEFNGRVFHKVEGAEIMYHVAVGRAIVDFLPLAATSWGYVGGRQ